MISQYITYNNTGMIQEHLHAQEHIWTSGTILDRTSSNMAQSATHLQIHGTSSSARHPNQDALIHQNAAV